MPILKRGYGMDAPLALPVGLEQSLRGFSQPFPLKTTPYVPPTPAEDDTPPILRWGRASNFSSSAGDDNFGFEVRQPANPNEPDQSNIVQYEEMNRQVEVVRVTNPEDSNQYVDVERIKSITFRDNRNIVHQFTLNS